MNYKDFVAPHENADEIPDDYFFERFRLWRNAELAACDWTQVADSTANKTAWATYRQALRDLPANNADPKKIKFPTRPEA
jgi:hypothetical protein